MNNTRKNFRTDLWLFTGSLLVYFFYFHPILFQPNSVLSSITLDSLKNYYTFVFHIKNDSQWLHFEGMHYPYGEHVVYTDCQPLFTFLLKILPFTHSYLIGILHYLLFFSFIILPLILIRIFRHLEVDNFTGALCSLAITLLSPQFLKINAGHHALAYAWVIPLGFLLILNYVKNRNSKTFIELFLYNTLLFLIHPYHGFSLSVFTLLAVAINELFGSDKSKWANKALHVFSLGVFPIVLFKMFMTFTDHHEDRTVEPYGGPTMTENIDTLFAPVFGPFKTFLQSIFPNPTSHFEGHSYLGFSAIILLLLFLPVLILRFRKIRISKLSLIILIPSTILLFLAFGWHHTIMEALHIKSAALNQFRATCRFAWYFYYALPIFLATGLFHFFKVINLKAIHFCAVTILLLNLWEAHYLFKLDEEAFWKFRNVFNSSQLNDEEKKVLQRIAKTGPQALMPLPLFHGGSEMYDRPGSNNSMIPSMIYSFHSGVPIFSGLMSRTSISETENYLQLLNPYKREKAVIKHLNNEPFIVLKTHDHLLPAEEQVLHTVNFFSQNDTLSIGELAFKYLVNKKIAGRMQTYNRETAVMSDSSGFLFIPTLDQKPFAKANMKDYEKIFTLDSNKVQSGKYVVSFRFYYSEKVYRSLSCNLVIARGKNDYYQWEQNISIRYLSGFYEGFGVFEYFLTIDRDSRYEFILGGTEDKDYHISDFMLRSADLTVLTTERNDTIINNYPINHP